MKMLWLRSLKMFLNNILKFIFSFNSKKGYKLVYWLALTSQGEGLNPTYINVFMWNFSQKQNKTKKEKSV